MELTTESIKGRAVEVGFRLLLPVVAVESLALAILPVESNEAVSRFEFECLNPDLDKGASVGSFSTFCSKSGISIVFGGLSEFVC